MYLLCQKHLLLLLFLFFPIEKSNLRARFPEEFSSQDSTDVSVSCSCFAPLQMRLLSVWENSDLQISLNKRHFSTQTSSVLFWFIRHILSFSRWAAKILNFFFFHLCCISWINSFWKLLDTLPNHSKIVWRVLILTKVTAAEL